MSSKKDAEMWERIRKSQKSGIRAVSGGPVSTTLFSSGNVGPTVAKYLGTPALTSLALANKESKKYVNSAIKNLGKDRLPDDKSIREWRERFPDANYLNIGGGVGGRGRTISEDDFQYFAGLEYLDISYCRGEFTEAAFAHLRGIHTLNISHVLFREGEEDDWSNITENFFPHLRGIHTLVMWRCTGITDAAFVHLRGIHTLDMSFCRSITDAAFVHLAGIHTLIMQGCEQLTDSCFVHLRGIHTLDMNSCTSITNNAFENLRGIKVLDMQRCPDITDDAFQHLKGIESLNMIICFGITDEAFIYLRGIHTLMIDGCGHLNGSGFQYLSGIHTLRMSDCINITDNALAHIRGIHTLDIRACHITDAAFVHLEGIHTLLMGGFPHITDAAFVHLRGIHTLDISNWGDGIDITDAIFVNLNGINTLNMQFCNKPGLIGENLYYLGCKLRYLYVHGCNPKLIENAKKFYGVSEERVYDNMVGKPVTKHSIECSRKPGAKFGFSLPPLQTRNRKRKLKIRKRKSRRN